MVYPGPSPVSAGIHLTSPSTDYSSVYVSPQYLNGTLDGNAVSLFAYCVDILNYSGPGTFDVVSRRGVALPPGSHRVSVEAQDADG